MTEITLSHLAQQTGIDEEKLLERLQQVDPAYQAKAISSKQAFDLVPGVRRQSDLMTLSESMAVTRALQSIAERPDESHLAADFPTITPASTQSTSKRGYPRMNDDELLEQQARRNWNADADLRAEFGGDCDAYLYYCKLEAAGKVKICGTGNVIRGARP